MTRGRALSICTVASCVLVAAGCGGPPGMRDRDSGADTSASGSCSEESFEACVYPSRGLSFTTTPREDAMVLHVFDELTGRNLPVVVYVPDGEGPFPVVVFSHGGGFSEGHNDSQNWGREFAAHGYVSIHYGSIEHDATAQMAYCEIAGVTPEECSSGPIDPEAILAIGRTRDVIAVMDALEDLSAASVARGGPVLDIERLAVAGWSGGSRPSAIVMGAETYVSPSVPSFGQADPRPRAAVMLSPTGPGFGAFYDEGGATSWDDMRGPTLMATGDNDIKPDNTELTGPIRRFPFDAQPGDGARHLLYSTLDVPEFGHGIYNLGELDSTDERIRRLSLAVSSVARAFLDAYVLGEEAGMAYLESDHARILAGPSEWLQR